MPTAITKRPRGRYRTTIPKHLARETGLFEGDPPAYRVRMCCQAGEPALEFTFGADPDDDGTLRPSIESGQARVLLTPFFGRAWNLEGVDLDWDFDIDGGYSGAVLTATLQEWTPRVELQPADLDGQFWIGASANATASTVQLGIPKACADGAGLGSESVPVQASFDCVGGERVVALEAAPDRDVDDPDVMVVNAKETPAETYQYYLQSKRLADAFGILVALKTDSVRVEWCAPPQRDDDVLFFGRVPATDGDAA